MHQPYTIRSGTTAGVAGAAAATSPVNGEGAKIVRGALEAIALDFEGTHAATTDVIVRTRGKHGPVQTLLSLTNIATDGWFYPRVETIAPDGSPAFYDRFVIDDEVEVVLAQDDPDVSLTALLLMIE